MRHATQAMTLGTYAQAISGDKRAAQTRITKLLGMETGEEEPAVKDTQYRLSPICRLRPVTSKGHLC
jgi:hypothetical protein